MKTKFNLFHVRLFYAVALGIGSSFSLSATAADSAATAPAKTSIPWSQLGAKAGADYQGDGLAVIATAGGARLRCAFQRLEGQATREGLWLASTVIPPSGTVRDRFRVVATAVGRLDGAFGVPALAGLGSEPLRHTGGAVAGPAKAGTPNQPLPRTGTVSLDGQTVRFTRPGVTEEYSVSMDGARQDFIIEQRPVGEGPLRVDLAVNGARVEPAAGGAQLALENSGRKIAYSRLRVTDATGKELTARMQVLKSNSESRKQKAEICPALVVVVNDAEAVYPVRIDPTFSDANWSSMNPGIPGADSQVHAAVVDGSGNLYIGGYFTIAGDVFANHIAKWDGSSWSALGSGMGGGDPSRPATSVSALAVSGSDLYAGGNFTTAGGSPATNIAKWDGSSWSALGSGMNSVVSALAVSGSDLYAGGNFTTAGGSPATNIARWDGSIWTALGSGMGRIDGSLPSVSALAVSGSNLYAGGDFTKAGGSPANRIAKWDGSSWSALGSGMDDGVLALAVSGSDVYAGGLFTMAGGSAANSIAKWDGSSWSALGSGMNGDLIGAGASVNSLAVSGSDVYAGGLFTMAGDSAANSIAKWNGSSWSALGSGIGGAGKYNAPFVLALAVSGSNLHAGGVFRTAGGISANYIAKWDGSSWTALGSGMNDQVTALAVSGSNVYATAAGSAANYIAKWDGSSWSTLGSGMNSSVLALAVSGSNLYAGGYFRTAGGTAANYIAKWNGSSWSALGSGMDGDDPTVSVSALAVSGSDLYAGGHFTTAGGTAASYIAKWNGSSWTALGSGMDGDVFALAVSGSDLYAGGYFSSAGGTPAVTIAKWNGSSWSALGSGMGGDVFALAVSGSDLYAGGYFTTADGSAANYIAKWDGSSWSALGSGMNDQVTALAVSGSDLYAGGYFTTAGGSAATNIAKWNGSSWSALGSGMNNRVLALAVSASDLYAGGNFTTAGGKVSANIARAYLLALPTLSVLRSGMPQGGIMVSWPSVDTASFALEQAATLAPPPSWVTNAASITDDGTNKSVTFPATNSAQLFRLRRP